ncbi:MAG: N-acetylmuramic acid 6-phosphate etherase, partial [Candidatus Limnocylindria bacterium]
MRAAIAEIERATDAIASALAAGGRLRYVGAGTSGRLGVLDASEAPPTFGVDPDLVHGVIAGGDRALRTSVEGAEDDAAAGTRDIAPLVRGGDVVVGISAGGRAPYV